jgi:hypothetical protein
MLTPTPELSKFPKNTWPAPSAGSGVDYEWAAWFAKRFPHIGEDWPGAVISGRVRHERILALFQTRKEAEVVVFPRYVYARRVQSVSNAK